MSVTYVDLVLNCGTRVKIDRVDYHWAIRWNWAAILNSSKKKKYASRSTRVKGGKQVRLYLHKEILIRTGALQPSDAHTIADHLNGDSLDCRRSNLRWATHKENANNINGRYARENWESENAGTECFL